FPLDPWDIAPPKEYVAEIAALSGCEVKTVSSWLNAVSVEIDENTALSLADLPFVTSVSKVTGARSPELKLALEGTEGTRHPYYGYGYNQIEMCQLPALNDEGYTGSGVTVALLDAGFDVYGDHCFDQMDILAARDFTPQGDVYLDYSGHGSTVLSIIGAYAPGMLVGPCPDATFILAKTEVTRGQFDHPYEEDFWVNGLTWAEGLGADIVTSSLGYMGFAYGRGYDYSDMDGETTIVTRAANIAVAKGLYVCTSAGNGDVNLWPRYEALSAPADGFRVAAIGAVEPDWGLADLSAGGPTADGRMKPEYLAQGTEVFGVTVNNPNQDYWYHDGTSMSCPITASAAALVLQKNPGFTADDIRISLARTATHADNPDNEWGFGIVQAYDAANFDPSGIADAEKPTVTLLHGDTFAAGSTQPFGFDVTATDPDGISYWQLAVTRAGDLLDPVYLHYGSGEQNGIVLWGGLDYWGDTIAPGEYDTYLTAWDRYGYVRSVSGGTFAVSASAAAADNVYVFPNPFSPARGDRGLNFANVPAGSAITVYTISGDVVTSVDSPDGGTTTIRPEPLEMASGVYLYRVDAGANGTKVGRFAVIN
ncbi:MAG: S8 family serine peptidase, partial [bacterium]|nr:S8 family serine peptidase [bacterium]